MYMEDMVTDMRVLLPGEVELFHFLGVVRTEQGLREQEKQLWFQLCLLHTEKLSSGGSFFIICSLIFFSSLT